VEGGEAQRHAFDPLLVAGGADLTLGGGDRVDDRLDAAVALAADRVVLRARALVRAEAVDAEEDSLTKRRAPAATAESSRWRTPRSRSSLVGRMCDGRAGFAGMRVIMLTTASGRAARTARISASASMASATTGSAPSSASIGALAALEVMATTSWPRSSSSRTAGGPMAPLAPAKKTLIVFMAPETRWRAAL
jgi:hypothetical protein